MLIIGLWRLVFIYILTFKYLLMNPLREKKKKICSLLWHVLLVFTCCSKYHVFNGSIIASNPGLVTCGSSCANELVESLVAEVEAHNEVGKVYSVN